MWNEEKKQIEFQGKPKRAKRWEIWVAKIWINIGSELSKDSFFTRPVLVVWNHMWWDLVAIIPITSKYNDNYSSFLFEIHNFEKYGLRRKSYLCLNHLKTISIKRLTRRVNGYYRWTYEKQMLSPNFMNMILDKICILIKKHPKNKP